MYFFGVRQCPTCNEYIDVRINRNSMGSYLLFAKIQTLGDKIRSGSGDTPSNMNVLTINHIKKPRGKHDTLF